MNLQIQKEVKRKKFPGGKQKILLWGSRHSTQIMSDKKSMEREEQVIVWGTSQKNMKNQYLGHHIWLFDWLVGNIGGTFYDADNS